MQIADRMYSCMSCVCEYIRSGVFLLRKYAYAFARKEL